MPECANLPAALPEGVRQINTNSGRQLEIHDAAQRRANTHGHSYHTLEITWPVLHLRQRGRRNAKSDHRTPVANWSGLCSFRSHVAKPSVSGDCVASGVLFRAPPPGHKQGMDTLPPAQTREGVIMVDDRRGHSGLGARLWQRPWFFLLCVCVCVSPVEEPRQGRSASAGPKSWRL